MKRLRHGSCHCGTVRFECSVDLAPAGQRSEPERPGVWWTSTFRCNCTFCLKTHYWKAFVLPADLRVTAGQEALSDYQFGERQIHHYFCSRCGIHPFASASYEPMGGAFHAVNINTLDDVTPEEFAAAPITYEDGRNDDWSSAPAVTRHL
ncbi:GFA family protein [Phreatobacter stygius]|uniref:GFA family protein n=1 Tax=Phreatobacter stygius TaxID=1940610 RepID=A0A4D7B3C9_9HYPH|nr:GFA family protein [Phreatobacter stygius]QCI67411.1 GFA family protein [Phreatobacter stygius]